MTEIATLYDPLRAILGDFNASRRQFSDGALSAAIQMCLLTGQLEGYALSGTTDITPDLATPRAYGTLLYKAALALVAPNSTEYGFKTRAFAERTGNQKIFITELHRVLYEMETPSMLGTFGDFSTWLTGVTGLNIWTSMTDMVVDAPVGTATIGQSGLTVT